MTTTTKAKSHLPPQVVNKLLAREGQERIDAIQELITRYQLSVDRVECLRPGLDDRWKGAQARHFRRCLQQLYALAFVTQENMGV